MAAGYCNKPLPKSIFISYNTIAESVGKSTLSPLLYIDIPVYGANLDLVLAARN